MIITVYSTSPALKKKKKKILLNDCYSYYLICLTCQFIENVLIILTPKCIFYISGNQK